MSTAPPEDSFLYFAYGSNLLKERIHIQNPSAIKKDIAKLKDYRLGFNYRSKRWRGAVATIEPSPGDHVWGVLWALNKKHMSSLDDQENVKDGIYNPISVTVVNRSDKKFVCRCYQLLITDSEDTRPSKAYKDVILHGAQQNDLPAEYLRKLKCIPDNGIVEGISVIVPNSVNTE